MKPIYVVITPKGEVAVTHGRTVHAHETPIEPPTDCRLQLYVPADTGTSTTMTALSLSAGTFQKEQTTLAAAIAWRRAVKEYLTISSTAPWNSRAALGQRIQRLERELSILVDNLEQGSPK